MNDLDRKIQAALSRDPAGDPLAEEPNIAEEVLAAFRGRHRWLSALAAALQLAGVAGLVFAAFRFCQADALALQLRWGALAVVLLAATTMIKVWFWLELHTNRVLREVKRVELLLVSRSRS